MSTTTVDGVEIFANDAGRVTQAPSDVLRMAVAVVTLLVVTLLGVLFGETMVEFTADLLRGLDRLPSWLLTAVAAIAQVLGVVLFVAGIAAVVRSREWRTLVAAVVAAAAAALLAAGLRELVGPAAEKVVDADSLAAIGGGQAWSAGAVAALVAIVTVAVPWVPRPWRRVAWALTMAVALVHFVESPVAFDTLLALLAGWTAGAAVVVVLGAPSQRPTGAGIAAGLAAVGQPLAKLEQASLDARGSTPYFATAPDGSKLFVKALGADERSADLLFRIYRRIQPRDLGDEKADASLRRAVEHEALVSLMARQMGVRTPRVAAFASTEHPPGFVLAYDAIAGRSLDRLEPDEMTDQVLALCWEQLTTLRSHRVAHRDLRLANVFLADDGAAWIIDFGFSEIAASDLLLATDLAELTASLATVVGPRRALDSGVAAVGAPAMATALPRLKLPMLSGATRTALKAQPGRLDELRTLVAALPN
ncbi:phosphotransferase [Aquihabitans daechungensis]|uniref:phosphotransferase n=1 Tax=Aquihabitans daechungensis TaxID=1052257 RepID=UPI003BA0FA30